jgi:hypothetical protein
MSQNVQNWLYVLLIILVPLVLVHVFSSATTRLVALLWVASLVPIIFTILLFTSGQTVRLRNYSNPTVERRLTIGVKALVCILIVMMVWIFTVPIWRGAFDVYVEGHPFTVISGKISSVSTTVLSPGMYWNLHLERNDDGYAYLFPTVFSFPDKEYELTLLPSTNFVLDVR